MNPHPASAPVLLACAHGTRDERGQRAVAALVEQVRAALPEVDVVDTWVDVQEPDLAQRTREHAEHPAVVVPLLLSAGYHVFVDMARAVESSPQHVVAAALGPDRRLAAVMARRLTEALDAAGAPGLAPADRVLMVAAGSSDPRSRDDCELMARYLGDALGTPVTAAYLSAARPSVPDAVAAARAELGRHVEHPDSRDAEADPQMPRRTEGTPDDAGRVLLVPYLLAPGFFHGRVLTAGGDVVAEPLLVHPGSVPPELVELTVEHYREAASRA
ncbi:sirohydrochlorin chelatase [Kocuria marina]|uniref:sirohydrochlorin chelatase n=1 Tax=Kocuria marina TaxID=223184 RepID=UPI0022DEA253|nr:CbiX/SirB N-terminal domain-containing protein [Kocuria marina]